MASSEKYLRSFKGVLTAIYHSQKSSSKVRGHAPPAYSKSELGEWLTAQPMLTTLWGAWENSGYLSEFKPSVDRLDDTKGYSFSNIRLVTWAVNEAKGHLLHDKKQAVTQSTLCGKYIAEHASILEAANSIGKPTRNIRKCVKGERNKAYGFTWNCPAMGK